VEWRIALRHWQTLILTLRNWHRMKRTLRYRDYLRAIGAGRRELGFNDIVASRPATGPIKLQPDESAALPTLLGDAEDRRRFLTLLGRLVADPRIRAAAIDTQREMLARIRGVLCEGAIVPESGLPA
jgi:hypothetical protein